MQTTKDSLIDTQRTPRAPDNAILEAFAKDQGAAAEAVAKLLQNPTPDRAAALLKDLPNLLPEDPALAAVIAEEMAKAYAEAWEKARGRKPDNPDNPENPADAALTNSGTSEGARKGWITRRKNGWSMEQLKENKIKAARLIESVLSDDGNGDAPPLNWGL